VADLDIERSKYLGGDTEHTHLVKGLDFALLYKIRREAERERGEAKPKPEKAGPGASSEARPSAFARCVLSAALSSHAEALRAEAAASAASVRGRAGSASSNAALRERMRRALLSSSTASRFAPRRLTFDLDTGTDVDAPGYTEEAGVTLRGEAECPPPEPGVFASLAPDLMWAVSEVAAAARDGDEALRKLRRRRRRREREEAEAAAAAAPTAGGASTPVAAGPSPASSGAVAASSGGGRRPDPTGGAGGDDDDDDDDVFGDVDDDYDFGEPAFAPAGPGPGPGPEAPPPHVGAAADGSGRVFDRTGGAGVRRQSASTLLKEGRLRKLDADGEEDELDGVEGYVEEGAGGDDGYGDLGLEGGAGVMDARALALAKEDGADADAGLDTGGKLRGRGMTKRRYDFATEEEFERYKRSQESAPSSAFQFGVKKGQGRANEKQMAKRKEAAEKRRFEKDLEAVQGLVDQRRQSGKRSKAPDDPSAAKRAKLGGSGGFVR